MAQEPFFTVRRTKTETRLRLRRGYVATHLREVGTLLHPLFLLVLFVPCMGIVCVSGEKPIGLAEVLLHSLILLLCILFLYGTANFLMLATGSLRWMVLLKKSEPLSDRPRIVVQFEKNQLTTPRTIQTSVAIEDGDVENGIGGSLCAEIQLRADSHGTATSLVIRAPRHSTLHRQIAEQEAKQLGDWLEKELGLTRSEPIR